MAQFSPRQELTPTSEKKQSASISSMERALRTLTHTSSPVPLTPRRYDGCGVSEPPFKPSISASRRAEERSEDSSSGEEEAVRVVVRVRPLAPGGDQCAGRAWRVSPEQNAIVEIPGARNDQSYATPSRTHRGLGDTEFIYDKVFGEDANTCEIYDAVVSDLVESLTEEGINGTVFTYGQTCSGKTFTMQGCDRNESCVGIVQLAAKDIFQYIKDDDSNSECSVRVSYVEIYNEELRDLLNDSSRKSSTSLIIREDKRGSIAVDGLKEVAVKSLEQLVDVFRVGEKNKSVGSTKMNDRSSRSHAILKIMLEKRTILNAEDKENFADDNSASDDLVVKTSSVLNLVDLAGSESVRHTGASGMQKKEGGMINQSLLTLSKVLMSLGQKNPGHVNYRDSKLTRILKPSLCGNARMAVICCVSPSGKYVEETRSTLQFATRAKLVKTNAVRHEEVEDADLITTLRLENARAKWANRKLEDELRNMKKLNHNALTTKRELANLKKFVFSEKPQGVSRSRVDQRLSLAPLNLVDNHGCVSVGKTSKDDLCIHSRSTRESELCASSSSGSFLRDALGFKAKQVKNLQARIDRLNEGEATKATRDKRYSLISEARYSNFHRRIDLVDETRSPVDGKSKIESKDYYSQTDMVQLESKLVSANNLIEGLERQIDDLSEQKNDALDWIEELFAKSDQKDEKIRHANEERNNAIKRCEKLDNDLLKVKELLHRSDEKLLLNAKDSNVKISLMEAKIESAQDMLSQVNMENMQLLQDKRHADNTLSELEAEIARLKYVDGMSNAAQSVDESNVDREYASDLEKSNVELKSRVQELQDYTTAYAEEKQSLIEQIEKYEEDLSMVEGLLKSKSDELDDAMFSLNKERESWLNEKGNLTKKMKGAGQSLTTASYQEDIDSLIGVNEKLREKISSLSDELKDANQQLHSAHEDRAKIDEVMEENKMLVAEQRRLQNDNNECMQGIGKLSDQLTDLRQQLKNANQNGATHISHELDRLKAENTRLRVESRHLTNDFEDCFKKMSDLSSELLSTQQQLQDARNGEESSSRLVKSETEKSELVERLDSANAKIKELHGQISVTTKELKIQEKAKAQLCSSFSRVQQLVDALSSENSDLNEKNESLERARECLENRSRELQNLLSTASTDRDKLMESNTNLSSKFRMISIERDEAIRDKKRFKANLDKIAADFEADYETVRSKIDNLLEEKNRLEGKVTFLEASKASVEDNADRILERDNTLARQHDRLKAEYKKQTMMMADLQNVANQLRQRLERMNSENERLSRDARALKELNNRYHEGRLFDESNDKRRAIFGFRVDKYKDSGDQTPWGL